MDRAHGKQRRHVAGAGAHRREAVGEHHDLGALAHRVRRRAADPLDGVAQTPRAGAHVVPRGDLPRLELAGAQCGHLRVVEDRRAEHQLARVPGLGGEQIAAPAEVHGERHDEALAQRVDGRVGHLREALGEVIVQRVRPAREDRQGRIVAHREARFAGLPSHGQDDEVDVFGREARRRLTRQQVAGLFAPARSSLRRAGRARERQRRQRAPLLAQPLGVGPARRDRRLDGRVAQEQARAQSRRRSSGRGRDARVRRSHRPAGARPRPRRRPQAGRCA